MPRSRRRNPETSLEAHDTIWCPNRVQSIILDIICQHGPICDDQIARRYYQRAARTGDVLPSPESLRTRRSELVDKGLVEFSGVFTLTESLRRTREWSAVL
jgi:hypothetical protein